MAIAVAAFPAAPATAQAGMQGDVTRAQMQDSLPSQLGRLDLNGDGFISKDELDTVLGLVAQSGAPAQVGERLQTMFDKFAKAGKVSIAEVVASQMAAFDKADVNHDGKLSQQERDAATAAARAEAGAGENKAPAGK